MYDSIFELPSQVRSALDEPDQEVWRKAYNAEDPRSKDEVLRATRKAWRACKDLPSSFSFRAVASVEDVDRDGEVIDIDSIRKQMESFLAFGGNIQYGHSAYHVGLAWDWNPIEKDGKDGVEIWGNVFGGGPVYDEARKAFVKGHSSLSVGGEADRGRFQCDEKGCYTKRDLKQLLEISLCSVPANKHCKMIWYNDKARLQKSADDDMRFDVVEYEIHRDRDNCPIHQLRKSMEPLGFGEMHVRPEGVLVEDCTPVQRRGLMECGYAVVKYGEGYIVNTVDKIVEQEFRKGYSAGYLDRMGMVGDISSKDLDRLLDAGLIRKGDRGYALLMPAPPEDGVF